MYLFIVSSSERYSLVRSFLKEKLSPYLSNKWSPAKETKTQPREKHRFYLHRSLCFVRRQLILELFSVELSRTQR